MMKVKEKLALDDYNENRFRMDQTTYESLLIESAFIAGFEKAREMAKADTIQWLEVTGAIPKGTSYYNELVHGFDDLGEEEAPEPAPPDEL